MTHRCFVLGFVLLVAGIQLRYIESFVLTQKASEFIETNVKQAGFQHEDPYDTFLLTAGPSPKKTITPPRWLGWALMSVGGVMLLHGLTIQRQN